MGKVENLGLNNGQGWEKEKTQGFVKKNKVGNFITSPNNNPGVCIRQLRVLIPRVQTRCIYIFWATCISHWQTLMVFRSILSGYAPRPRCFLPMSPGKMCFWVLSLLIIPPQCEMLSKSTRVEVLVMAKQWGSTQAFLFFWTRCWTKLGLASTRRPVH